MCVCCSLSSSGNIHFNSAAPVEFQYFSRCAMYVQRSSLVCDVLNCVLKHLLQIIVDFCDVKKFFRATTLRRIAI